MVAAGMRKAACMRVTEFVVPLHVTSPSNSDHYALIE